MSQVEDIPGGASRAIEGGVAGASREQASAWDILPEEVLAFRPRHSTDQIEWQGLIGIAPWLIAMTRPSRFVELGTHKGDSYCSFCQAIVEQGVSCEAFAIDMWTGDDHTGGYGEEVYARLRDYHDPLYGGFSRLTRMKFEEALPSFEDGSVDLLHIDGLHTYEAVKEDFETWLPKMSRRGVVVFHDSTVRERDFGVYRLLSELHERYEGFDFNFSNGLGVVILDAEAAPSGIVRAARLPEAEFRRLSHVLKTLGDMHVATSKMRYYAGEAAAMKRAFEENSRVYHEQAARYRNGLGSVLRRMLGGRGTNEQ